MVFGTSLPRTVPSPSYCFSKGRFFLARFPFLPRVHINKHNLRKARNENKFLPISTGHPYGVVV